MVRALPERPIATPTVLGVDEFALRRGRRYGTILVDAEAHTIVELLEDPSADALGAWLSNHPSAKVICRDRDGVYASAARRGAPEALQVADRWHLVHNLADALERFAVRVLAALRKELTAAEPAYTSPSAETLLAKTEASSPGRLMLRNAQRHTEIHELMAQGLTVSAIARRVRLDRKTVRRFASAEVANDLLGPHGRRATALDPFLPYLARRWREASTSQPFCSTRSVARAIVAASVPFDVSWQTGAPPSRRLQRMRSYPARGRSFGCSCGERLTWTTKSTCFSSICLSEARNWSVRASWHSTSSV